MVTAVQIDDLFWEAQAAFDADPPMPDRAATLLLSARREIVATLQEHESREDQAARDRS